MTLGRCSGVFGWPLLSEQQKVPGRRPGLLVESLSFWSGLPSPHLPECSPHAVAGNAALLLIALAGLELAFDLFAVNGVGPLFAAGAAVEHEIGSNLITTPVLTGAQECEQVATQVSEAQLFVQFLLLAGKELLLLLHLKEAGDAGGDGVSGEAWVVGAGTSWEHSGIGEE
jgi:hypothetical protein